MAESTAEDQQAASDRETILNLLRRIPREALPSLAAAADVGTLPVRGVMGAVNSALRLPNALGAGIPYIPEYAFGGSSSSLTPYFDRLRAADAPPTQQPPSAALQALDRINGVGQPAPAAAPKSALPAAPAASPAQPPMPRSAAGAPRAATNIYDTLVKAQQDYQKRAGAAQEGLALPEASTLEADVTRKLGEVKEAKGDPYGSSLGRFMALLGAQGLANRGNMGQAFAAALPEYYKNIDSERALAREDVKLKKGEIGDLAKLGAADMHSRNLRTAADNARKIGAVQATDPTATTALRVHEADAQQNERMARAHDAILRSAYVAKTPAEQAQAWAKAMQDAGDKRATPVLMEEFLRKGKAPAEHPEHFVKFLEAAGGNPAVADALSRQARGELSPAQVQEIINMSKRK